MEFQGTWCFRSGARVETALIRGLPLGSFRYMCRLSHWLAKESGDPSNCDHRDLGDPRRGGWEVFLAYHPLFCPLCHRRNN